MTLRRTGVTILSNLSKLQQESETNDKTQNLPAEGFSVSPKKPCPNTANVTVTSYVFEIIGQVKLYTSPSDV